MICIVIGGGILVILLIWQIQKWKLYEPIMAKCSGITIKNRGFNKSSNASYIYTYGGNKYIFKEKYWYGSTKRQEGEMHKIHVMRNKPWKCITSDENTLAVYELIFGIMIFVSGLFCL